MTVKKEVGWEKDSEGCNQGDTARQGENEHVRQSLGETMLQEDQSWGPGGPVVRTPCFPLRAQELIPDWGLEILQATVSPNKKKNHSREVLKPRRNHEG